ncbi:hypothetical protein QAD02_018408 [Eretmocerus hayati]|uniref:Uncharacterized protein n=1 Tax=Eretmocerus hayati TaxID=131215 RepID=A0ACC2PIH0_9HYME|nr:hypothetical protein QAD02_018408 [Eretmocerus hayati]
MMYALVLWLEAQQFSVLPDGDIRGDEEKEAKWGNDYYPVKVIIRSMNKEWLESLRVTVDGEIIPDGDSVAQSQELMFRRVADRQTQNATNKTLAASKRAYQQRLLRSSTIFGIGNDLLNDPPNNEGSTEDEDIENPPTQTNNALPGRAGSNGTGSPDTSSDGVQDAIHRAQDDVRGTEDSPDRTEGATGGIQNASNESQQANSACLCSKLPKGVCDEIKFCLSRFPLDFKT